MRSLKFLLAASTLVFLFADCDDKNAGGGEFFLEAVYIGNQPAPGSGQPVTDVPVDLPLELIFSAPVDRASATDAFHFEKDNAPVSFTLRYANGDKNVRLAPSGQLSYHSTYTLTITDALRSQTGGSFIERQFVFQTVNGTVRVTSWTIDGQPANSFSYLTEVSLQPKVDITFSSAVNAASIENSTRLTGGASGSPTFSFSADFTELEISYPTPLEDWNKYTFAITAQAQGINGEAFEPIQQVFYTQVDETPKFPALTEEDLLTLVQRQTFRYFWEFGHPVSGLARERNASNEVVTFGGSGFGLMAMIVAVERDFITLEEAISRWKRIVVFLETADRFHGAFQHWMNGTTGKVQPFSNLDNGGDLVETAFFVQGLLTVRQYLQRVAPQETELIDQINQYWEEVEWDWFTKGENEALYWHWSPEHEWAINLKIRGHNETQIAYVLAASSPTHGIEKEVYDKGYARSGAMLSGKTFYQQTLPAGPDYGGPLFFSHYSYLGLDPRNLKDQYVNYWTQNVRHSQINYAYCVDNPKNYVGYSAQCWGLTASDGNEGYSAHSPTNDRGVITPTAAISSIVYTPEESLAALRYFYYVLGDRLWGEYGFYDAFNPTAGWTADSFLAIDQGPIICMIENYRTGLLWELFMSCPEVRNGLTKLGFEF